MPRTTALPRLAAALSLAAAAAAATGCAHSPRERYFHTQKMVHHPAPPPAAPTAIATVPITPD